MAAFHIKHVYFYKPLGQKLAIGDEAATMVLDSDETGFHIRISHGKVLSIPEDAIFALPPLTAAWTKTYLYKTAEDADAAFKRHGKALENDGFQRKG